MKSTSGTVRIVFAGTLILFALSSHAQIIRIDSLSPWKKAFKVGLNFNQASFSSNWKGGGVNSIGFNTLMNYKANYKRGRNSWNNEVDFLYGSVRTQGLGYRKTNDRIFIDSKHGYALTSKWDLATSITLLTQFARGYNYETDALGVETETLISDFFAPGFITLALGFEYHPVDYFKVRISPMAPRVTIVNDPERFVTVDNPTPYGVTPPEQTRYEWFGAQILAEFNKDLMKNLNLKFRYVLYANYQEFTGERIDHRLDVSLTAKVNEFINVNINGILLYDYDQDLGLQASEALSLGFLYTIQNFEEKKP
jgi:hypothetical protein